jgi:WD40 repeat protein
MIRRRWFVSLIVVVSASTCGADEPGGLDLYGYPLPSGVITRLGTNRLRPGGSVQHLAFSPDGKNLVSWHEQMYVNNAFTMWDAATGRELRRVDVPGADLAHVRWLADGRGIAVLRVDDDYYLWEFTDTALKPPQPRFRGGAVAPRMAGLQSDNYACFAVSPDGKRLVGGRSGSESGKDRSIDVWDFTAGKKVSELPAPRRLATQPDNCSALYFTPDGRHLLALSPTKLEKGQTKECLVVVRNADTGAELRRFSSAAPLSQAARWSVAVTNQFVALGMEDEAATVSLWNLNDGTNRKFAAKHSRRQNGGFGISAITASPDGKLLLTAGRGGSEIKIWDAAALEPIRQVSLQNHPWIETLAVSPDGKTFASGGQHIPIRIWDTTTCAETLFPGDISGWVIGTELSPDGRTAVTFSADETVRVWDATTGRQLRSVHMSRNQGSYPHGEFAPDGRTLLVSSGDRLGAWNPINGKETKIAELPSDLVCQKLHFAMDGSTLLVQNEDKITLLAWPSGKTRCTVTLRPPAKQHGTAHCDTADLSPDGRWLVTLAHRSFYRDERGLRLGFGSDSVLDLWNAATGEHVRRLAEGQGVARGALFTAEGDVVLAGGAGARVNGIDGDVTLSGTLHLIDPLTGRLKRAFGGVGREAIGLGYMNVTALSADGRLLWIGSNHGPIVAYETLTGQVRQALNGLNGSVFAVTGSRDCKRIIGGGAGLNALIWDVSLIGNPSGFVRPREEEFAELWSQLRESNPKAAFPVMRRLGAHPDVAVQICRQNIKPVAAALEDAVLDRLVQELGDAKFAVREQAFKKLDDLGESAVVGLKSRLASATQQETRNRMMRLLAKHDPVTPTPEMIGEARALEILEQLGTTASRELLQSLAGGAANARRTQTAIEVLKRLHRRSAADRVAPTKD